MDKQLVPGLRLLVLQMLAIDALIHLSVVAPRLAASSVSGEFPRVVTVFMALSIAAIVVGALAVWAGAVSYRTAYLLVVLLTAGEIVGWLLFHNTGLGHTHDAGIVESTIEHVVGDPLETAAKTAEVVALALAAYLLRVDAAARTRRPSPVGRLLARDD
ncbi:hypothetical protein ACFQPA_09250 [Halomarina halobia]|uniref:Uncharacterized protein n=1 Tax=Halomarina halobia TaxID=3033386 RepID=A0ABD6AAW7_9EURY|nr:hypothetical protein [Halomarina sp. PSR21]